MSQQALSKAHSKFDHILFSKLFTGVRDAFYGKEYLDKLRKIHDKLVIAINGLETVLLNFPAFLKKFGVTNVKASSPTARMSIAYDVLNDFIIDADFTPLNVSDRVHAKNHIEAIGKIFDTVHLVDAYDDCLPHMDKETDTEHEQIDSYIEKSGDCNILIHFHNT